MTKKTITLAVLSLAAILWAGSQAWGATEQTYKMGSAFPTHFDKGIYIGPSVPNPTSDKLNKVTRMLAASATIDFTVISVGVQDSGAITVKGAQVGDECKVGTSTTVAALLATFDCYVSAADTVKVRFSPKSQQEGVSGVLNGASPSVVVVAGITASSRCTASVVGTAAGTAVMVSLTTTNLTLTGPNAASNVVNYNCAAPVDPASDTYRVYVRSNQ